MADFGQIKTRVQRRIIDLPAAVLAEIPDLVLDAVREIQRKHNFKVMETIQAQNTATLTRVLTTVPSNFKERRGLPYWTPSTGKVRKMGVAVNRQSMLASFEPASDGPPQFLLQSEPTDTGASNWETWPLPDGNSDYSDGQYRISIPYWRYLPALAADTDTNWFTVNAEMYIILRATAAGFGLDWDKENETLWLALANDKYKEVVQLDKLARLAGIDTLVPHTDGAASPQVNPRS
jgi:hypothetical protein